MQSGGSQRQTMITSLTMTAILAVYTLLASGGDWVTTVLFVPVIASASYWTLRLSQRVGARWASRAAARLERHDAPVQPQVPHTDRPEHVQHRREQERRRPRGRRAR